MINRSLTTNACFQLTLFLQSWLYDKETDPKQDKLPFSPSSQNLDKGRKEMLSIFFKCPLKTNSILGPFPY
jgi:hypothetical protein